MIGGIFKPILIVIIGAGVLQARILVSRSDLQGDSSYIFRWLGSAVFYFLPIFLAISSANVFKATLFWLPQWRFPAFPVSPICTAGEQRRLGFDVIRQDLLPT